MKEKLKNLFTRIIFEITQKKAVFLTAFFVISFLVGVIFLISRENDEQEILSEEFLITNIEKSLLLSQRWFDNSYEENNIFNYIYYPEKNAVAPDRDIVREIGSFWGYVRLYSFNKNEKSLENINRIREKIQEYIKYDTIDGVEIAFVEFNDISLINTQAFYLLALSELKKNGLDLTEREESDLKKIINGIYLMRAEDGGFWYVYYLPSELNKISPYGTSEALFGLISYYKYVEKDEKVLEFSKKVFEEYFEIAQKYSFEKEEARSFHSWVLYFLSEMYELDKGYYEYIEKLTNNALDYRFNNQICKNAGCLMYRMTISETGFLEGNIVAYKFLEENNYPRLGELRDYIELSAKDAYYMQIKSKDSYEEKTNKNFMGNENLLVGGFCGGRNDGDFFCESIRCDFTQHASSALLNYLKTFGG